MSVKVKADLFVMSVNVKVEFKNCSLRSRIYAGVGFEIRPPTTELVLKTNLFLYLNHKFKTVATWPLLINELLPIATTSSHTSMNTNVVRCYQ